MPLRVIRNSRIELSYSLSRIFTIDTSRWSWLRSSTQAGWLQGKLSRGLGVASVQGLLCGFSGGFSASPGRRVAWVLTAALPPNPDWTQQGLPAAVATALAKAKPVQVRWAETEATPTSSRLQTLPACRMARRQRWPQPWKTPGCWACSGSTPPGARALQRMEQPLVHRNLRTGLTDLGAVGLEGCRQPPPWGEQPPAFV